jgi:hypothetical protein
MRKNGGMVAALRSRKPSPPPFMPRRTRWYETVKVSPMRRPRPMV